MLPQILKRDFCALVLTGRLVACAGRKARFVHSTVVRYGWTNVAFASLSRIISTVGIFRCGHLTGARR